MSGYRNDYELVPDDGAEYLTTTEAAKVLRVHPGTLSNWRLQGHGPTFLRFGRLVRYKRTALDDWAEHNDHRSW